jgi:hypothetical protein
MIMNDPQLNYPYYYEIKEKISLFSLYQDLEEILGAQKSNNRVDFSFHTYRLVLFTVDPTIMSKVDEFLQSLSFPGIRIDTTPWERTRNPRSASRTKLIELHPL